MWRVVFSEVFAAWWDELDEDEQHQIQAAVDYLGDNGPTTGRPLVDSIEESRHSNMKELRPMVKNKEVRILFIFDPQRQAVLLMGGDKKGQWKRWYKRAIPQADAIYDDYLCQMEGKRKR